MNLELHNPSFRFSQLLLHIASFTAVPFRFSVVDTPIRGAANNLAEIASRGLDEHNFLREDLSSFRLVAV